MRGKVSKALRKSIYGDDGSHRQREYEKGAFYNRLFGAFSKWGTRGKEQFNRGITCICTGKRRAYQDAK